MDMVEAGYGQKNLNPPTRALPGRFGREYFHGSIQCRLTR
jgi:hypothetical protein